MVNIFVSVCAWGGGGGGLINIVVICVEGVCGGGVGGLVNIVVICVWRACVANNSINEKLILLPYDVL